VKLSRKLAATSGALLVAAATLFSAGAANAALTSPDEAPVSQVRTTGYSAVVDGFAPAEVVTATVDGVIAVAPLVASADGVVTTAPFIDPAALAGDVITYSLVGTSSAAQVFTVFVTWDTVDPALGSAPTTVTVSALASTGFTATTRGFAPGEVVDVGVSFGQTGGSVGSATADATGAVSFTYVETATAGDEYSLVFVGATQRAFFDFTVLADAAAPAPAPAPIAPAPAAAAAPELAATGTDVTAGVAAAGALLVAGAVLGTIALRRRNVTA
jgi:hypothetical protein